MRLFITGTGTGVGKTIVTTLLTEAFQSHFSEVLPIKLIESGIDEDNLSDSQLYQYATKEKLIQSAVVTLKNAYSPHLAANLENKEIDIPALVNKANSYTKSNRLVLFEGAGGLYVPITNDGFCMIDLISNMRIPTLLVADAKVGTINHTVLSVLAMKAKNIQPMGIILNRTKLDETLDQSNIEMIELLTNVPIIGTVPYNQKILQHLQDQVSRKNLIKDWNINHIIKQLEKRSRKDEQRTIYFDE